MSQSLFYKPVQKVAYKYVSDDSENRENFDTNEEYFNNQAEVIERQNQQSLGAIPDYINKSLHDNIIGSLSHGAAAQQFTPKKKQSNYYHQYDPYYEYLRKTGSFVDNNRTRIVSKVYSINSSARSSEPQIVTRNRTSLQTDALSFDTITENIGVSTSTKDVLKIYCPNHTVQRGEQITLSGTIGQHLAIKSIYKDINNELQNAIIFTNYSISVVFKCNFDTIIKDPLTGLPTSKIDKSMSFNPSFKIGAGISHADLKNYDTSDMYVTLSGFDISQIGMPFVGNVPINFLNSSHRIYFTNPDYKIINGIKVYSPDTLINVPNSNNIVEEITGFYIALQVPFISNSTNISDSIQSQTSTTSMRVGTGNPMIIDIVFDYVGGIPLNIINAHYPIDKYNIKGAHEVHNVTADTITVLLDKKTYYKELSQDGLSENNVSFGGSELELATIDSVLRGHSSSNEYTIQLPNSISNIVSVKLLGITLPNTAKVFTNMEGSQNTKIYWQNQDDGDFIYSVAINPGNYSPTDLQTALQDKIYSVPRKYVKSSNQNTSYTDRTFMAVSIDVPTNSVSFSAFKEAILRKPIQDINPPIPITGDGVGEYVLTISQDNHGLLEGDTVTFAGFVATNGIPAGILNTTHVITSVPSSDIYTVKVSNFNLLSGTRTASGGGFSARVLVPSAFKLFFNYPDTVGKELGFRKVGQPTAITPFKTSISNSDAYDSEIITEDVDGTRYVNDSSGNKSILVSNSVKLDGINYVMLVIRKLDNIINLSANKKITSFFAKINFRGLPGTMVFDDFVCPPLIFYEPIELSKLDIAFYTPEGELYDFDGIEHNFTLEITNIEYVPIDTGIVSTLSAF